MSKHMEFYIQDDAASIQIGKNAYRRVSIPINDFNAACDHYGFVKERTCRDDGDPSDFCCSECGARMFTEVNDAYTMIANDGQTIIKHPNYCPNCGAKVVGE